MRRAGNGPFSKLEMIRDWLTMLAAPPRLV
jgi:hypothetical protein